MDARVVRWRWWAGLALGLIAALTFAAIRPSAALADNNPPNVNGLSANQATLALQNWDKTVVITFVPALDQLPPSLGPDDALVYASHVILPPLDFKPPTPLPPEFELDLGAAVPDLTGLTPSDVDSRLNPLEFKGVPSPDGFQPDWVVQAQRPEAGTVLPFGSAVTVVLAPASVLPSTPNLSTTPVAPPPPPPPPPPRRFDPVLVGEVGGGSLAALLLIALVTTSSLRRSRRRRRPPPVEQVEARPHAGPIQPPELVSSLPSLSVRLEPRPNPGAVVFHEEVPK
jgi:hypothetical protein